jgi:hypothetical protein
MTVVSLLYVRFVPGLVMCPMHNTPTELPISLDGASGFRPRNLQSCLPARVYPMGFFPKLTGRLDVHRKLPLASRVLDIRFFRRGSILPPM